MRPRIQYGGRTARRRTHENLEKQVRSLQAA
jgi:hypothetical protein